MNTVLATRKMIDRHTGINIAKEINKIKDEFGILDVSCIVTDNAANMVVACDESHLSRLSCFAHSLQLSINKGLKQEAVAKAIGGAKRLVTHFHHSCVATEALKSHQLRYDNIVKPLNLVQDVETRWNSTYALMCRLIQLRIPVLAVLADDSLTKVADRYSLDLKNSWWRI